MSVKPILFSGPMVREAWRAEPRYDETKPRDILEGSARTTEADTGVQHPSPFWGKLRPGIFMPRWASRLTLRVEDVRVQQLQEIADDDIMAEGCYRENMIVGADSAGGVHREITADLYTMRPDSDPEGWSRNPTEAFIEYWDSLNHQRGYGWDTNPVVAAYTYTPIFENVDRVLERMAA